MLVVASKFNSNISQWNMSNSEDFDCIFNGAVSFSQRLCRDNERITTTKDMFKLLKQ